MLATVPLLALAALVRPSPQILGVSVSRSTTPRMVEAVTEGTALPNIDVELVPSVDDRGAPERVKIGDVLGSGKSVLLGMPGAFTPTCNDRHLPGYYTQADKFKALGVNTVAVVTMNDRFVNARWQADMEECTGVSDGVVKLLSDPRGDLAEGLGLIAYLGRALGVRTKRFALVVEDGQIKHVAVDEGSDLLDTTSAETILEVLKPSVVPSIDLDLDPKAALGLGLGALVVGYLFLQELATNF